MKTFHVFGFPVHFLGLMTGIGVLVGYLFARKEIKRKGLDVDVLDYLGFISIGAAIIGARVFYILFYNLDYYLESPLSVFRITDGGLSIHGGLVFAFLAAFIYIRIKKVSFLAYADAVAPSILLGQAIGRVGCDVFGKAMQRNYFWGVEYQGTLVHPVQMYEFVLNYLGFFLLWRFRKHTTYTGQLFFIYIILFSINRGVVEFFRINPSILGWFSVSHLLSVFFIASVVVLRTFVKNNTSTVSRDSVAQNQDDWIKDILMVLGFIIVSFVIFYSVQG